MIHGYVQSHIWYAPLVGDSRPEVQARNDNPKAAVIELDRSR